MAFLLKTFLMLRQAYSTHLLKRITFILALGDDVDEELDFDVNGDDEEKINHCFKDLNLHELENLKVGGC
jgi:hypothetical protein